MAAINDSIGQNTDIEKIYEYNYASSAMKHFPFSHSKTAISFNILLVLLIHLRNTYIFRSQLHIHIVNAVPCYYLW